MSIESALRLAAGPPCFKCNDGPRIRGHVVCAKCHDPKRCERCHTERFGSLGGVPEHTFSGRIDGPRTGRLLRSDDGC